MFWGSVGASKKRHLPRKKRQKQSLNMFKCNLGYLGQLKRSIYNIKNTFSYVR